MQTRTYGLLAGMLGGLGAVLIGGGVMTPEPEIRTAAAQETPTTNTATTTTTPVTSTVTVTTTATTTTTTPTTTTTATTTTATASPTATATRTNTPVPTATTVPPTSVPSQPATAPINLTLSGAQEVPPVNSPGTGNFRATAGAASLAYTLTAGGTTSPITMAHIHQGGPGVNGPIVADLMVPVPTGVASVNSSGVITEASLKGPLAGNMAGFMAALRAGQLYVNVHTIQYPAGELRANFPAPPGPPATGSSAIETGSSNQSMMYLAGALAGAGALAFGAGAFARRKH